MTSPVDNITGTVKSLLREDANFTVLHFPFVFNDAEGLDVDCVCDDAAVFVDFEDHAGLGFTLFVDDVPTVFGFGVSTSCDEMDSDRLPVANSCGPGLASRCDAEKSVGSVNSCDAIGLGFTSRWDAKKFDRCDLTGCDVIGAPLD